MSYLSLSSSFGSSSPPCSVTVSCNWSDSSCKGQQMLSNSATNDVHYHKTILEIHLGHAFRAQRCRASVTQIFGAPHKIFVHGCMLLSRGGWRHLNKKSSTSCTVQPKQCKGRKMLKQTKTHLNITSTNFICTEHCFKFHLCFSTSYI